MLIKLLRIVSNDFHTHEERTVRGLEIYQILTENLQKVNGTFKK